MQIYTTKQGDTFDIIAKKFYGNEKYIKELILANEDYVNILIFPSGTILNIPEIEINTSETINNDLPWR